MKVKVKQGALLYRVFNDKESKVARFDQEMEYCSTSFDKKYIIALDRNNVMYAIPKYKTEVL